MYIMYITLLLYTLIFSLSYINIFSLLYKYLLSCIVIIRVVTLAIPCKKLWYANKVFYNNNNNDHP